MSWLLLALGAVLAAGALILLVGALLPRRHLSAATVRLEASAQRVWELVSGFAEQGAWRPDVLEVERLPDVNGRPVWRERGERGSMTFVVEQYQPPRYMSIRIADKHLGFGGSWIYRVTPEDGGSRLTILERGEIHRPVHRFASRLFSGRRAGVRRFLEAVARAVGESARPEKVRDPRALEAENGRGGGPA